MSEKGRIMVTDDGTYGRIYVVWPAWKGVIRMKDVIQKFISPQRVSSHCAGTFATAKECMLLPRHCSFVVARFAPSLQNTFTWGWKGFRGQILSPKLRRIGEANVRAAKTLGWMLLIVSMIEGRIQFGMPHTGFVLHSPFVPTLPSSSLINFETPHCMTWGKHFRPHSCLKSSVVVRYNGHRHYVNYGR